VSKARSAIHPPTLSLPTVAGQRASSYVYRMDLKSRAHFLAGRFARNSIKGRRGVYLQLALAGHYSRVWCYMRWWLDQYGELPSGEHIVPKDMYYEPDGPNPFITRSGHALKVDFTKLQNDPEYPLTGRDDFHVIPDR
jgi:hypothetical protein